MDAREAARGSIPEREDARRAGVGVGFIGAGNVLPAYLQVLDRLAARGRAWEGPIYGRDVDGWDAIRRRRPDAHLVATADEVWASDVDVVVVITPAPTHARVRARGAAPRQARRLREAGRDASRRGRDGVRARRPIRLVRARGPVRAPVSHLPGTLDAGARRRDRLGAQRTGHVREHGRDLGRLVPRRRRRPDRRARRLQPEEPDDAARAGSSGVRGGRARDPGAGGGWAAHRSARRRRGARRAAPRTRRAVIGDGEPGRAALPQAGARAVRHRGNGEPARRRLGSARAGDLASCRRRVAVLGRGRSDVAVGRRAAGDGRGDRGRPPAPRRTAARPASGRRDRRRPRVGPNRCAGRGLVDVPRASTSPSTSTHARATVHDHTRPPEDQ